MIFCREDIYETMSRVRGENGKCGVSFGQFLCQSDAPCSEKRNFLTLLLEVTLSSEVINASKICCLFRDSSKALKSIKMSLSSSLRCFFIFGCNCNSFLVGLRNLIAVVIAKDD